MKGANVEASDEKAMTLGEITVSWKGTGGVTSRGSADKHKSRNREIHIQQKHLTAENKSCNDTGVS